MPTLIVNMKVVLFVGVGGGLVSSVYNDEDVSRIEDGDEGGSGNEDSDDSSRNSVRHFDLCR